jgi:hypothetical protein
MIERQLELLNKEPMGLILVFASFSKVSRRSALGYILFIASGCCEKTLTSMTLAVGQRTIHDALRAESTASSISASLRPAHFLAIS